MIKAVLIDVDNTLLDFDEYVKYAMKRGMEEFNIGKYEDWMYDDFCAVNSVCWRAYEDGEITYEDILKTRWNNVFEKIGVKGDGVAFEKFFKATLFNNAILIDGAIESLEYLSKKYIVCTATNGPHLQQENRLKISGISNYTLLNCISEEMGVKKPEKEFFETALSRINEKQREKGEAEISFEQTIMIGDSLSSDMKGAQNCGIKTCFFDKQKSGKKVEGIDYVITSLLQIKDIL